MSYKQIKWLILIIPTVTIGLWEYVRHEFLLPYISMELGNLLAPIIVLLVSLLLLPQLFKMIEHYQEELNRAKALQAVMEEREKIARELHDGIAQSLFFLSAQVAHIERMQGSDEVPLDKLKESVHRTNDYVRQAIANLRQSAELHIDPWTQSVDSLIEELRRETDLVIETKWELGEDDLTSKEKVELLAIVREALLNIYKHADAAHVRVEAMTTDRGWICQIVDDGKGFAGGTSQSGKHYGLKIMQDRADRMSWRLHIAREQGETKVKIMKEENPDVQVPRDDRR
jgi:two-component system nitrate/nitrite sensor histidine kinase NarQ